MTTDVRPPLTPLVARVIELGRGPPALVRWVSARLGSGMPAPELATLLAREFAPAAPAGETLAAVRARTRCASV